MDELQLHVPNTSVRTGISRELTPELIQEEIQNLSDNDIACAITVSLTRLETLNRLNLSITQRADIGQSFCALHVRLQPYFHQLNSRLCQTHLEREHYVTELQDWCRFNEELAILYKHLLNQRSRGKDQEDNEAAQWCYNALYFTTQSAQQHYLDNQALTSQHWTDISDLYRYAESHTWHELPMSDICTQFSVSTTSALLCEFSLLTACDPYRLDKKTLWFIHSYIKQWKRIVSLQARAPSKPENTLTIELGTTLSVLKPGTYSGDTYRYLQTRVFTKQLQDHQQVLLSGDNLSLHGLPVSMDQQEASRTLKIIYKSCTEADRAREERKATHQRIVMISEFTRVHRLLLNQKSEEPASSYEATCVDLSDGGFGVEYPAHRAVLRPNELVSVIAERNGQACVDLGLVRWVRKRADGTHRCGIQKLEGRPYAYHNQAQQQRQAAIILAQQDGKNLCITESEDDPGFKVGML